MAPLWSRTWSHSTKILMIRCCMSCGCGVIPSSSSTWLYVHRGRKDYQGRGGQDGHLNFHTAPEHRVLPVPAVALFRSRLQFQSPPHTRQKKEELVQRKIMPPWAKRSKLSVVLSGWTTLNLKCWSFSSKVPCTQSQLKTDSVSFSSANSLKLDWLPVFGKKIKSPHPPPQLLHELIIQFFQTFSLFWIQHGVRRH